MEFHDIPISSSSSSSSSSSDGDIRSPSVNNSSGSSNTRGGRNLSLAPTPSPKRKAGRKKFRETRHPVYHGVRERKGGKWVCEVREPHKKNRIWLGTYATPEMAARAHDVAAIALRGDSAVLNFPHLAWRLPQASSMSPDDIRAAASEAAKMCSVDDDQTRLFSNQHKCDSSIANVPVRETELIEEKEVVGLLPEMVMDEDEVFNMPLVVEEMARGLLLTPPASLWAECWDGMDSCYVDLSLWNLD